MTYEAKSSNRFKTPHLLVGWGEVIDKLTILEIKSEKLIEPTALKNVKKELSILRNIAQEPLELVSGLTVLKKQLAAVNRSLWRIEEQIRGKERKKKFDYRFISLARSVYKQNDKRARLKKKINILLNSDIIEEKSYKN